MTSLEINKSEDDDKIYVGYLNPPPESNDKDTTYFTESRLNDALEKKLFDNLPIYINHNTKDDKGNDLDSVGKVLSAHQDENGLKIFFELSEKNKSNELAKALMSGDFGMKGLSMGYDILLDEDGKAVNNIPKEVSICYEGQRRGTHIMGSLNKKELLEFENNNNNTTIIDTSTTIVKNKKDILDQIIQL